MKLYDAVRAAILVLALGSTSIESYGDEWAGYAGDVGDKFGRGLANASLGWVEMVKGVGIAASHDGPAFIPFGFVKGLGHTLGRTLSGAFDLVTFLIPTAPLSDPTYVWDRFDQETQYGYFEPSKRRSSK
ncbi:exosortase system-associated protein, TIGR04073 family [Methylococcus sp. ANG]|uniref:exosortase system-associated protein, TIGR04073 family n=1 Tax=unclassified Methylococcus TaxID=2618889 RepID=UPI001C5291F9|nr:exosortase system-associated protein, TIGR04073 family [Methylococcus sp. Mc7]QXP83028.1 exosortase system-associated protein, TIGR04073 family [Methylococcus sp. Mc7]